MVQSAVEDVVLQLRFESWAQHVGVPARGLMQGFLVYPLQERLNVAASGVYVLYVLEVEDRVYVHVRLAVGHSEGYLDVQ